MAGTTVKTVTYPKSVTGGEDETNANNLPLRVVNISKDHEGNQIEDYDKEIGKNRPPPIDIPQYGNNSGGNGPKTPTPGPSSATGTGAGVTVARSKSEREKKIGHRRVTVGGDVTYKKIQTSQIMGAIQLGIQHAIGGLASKPERDLLMQDFMTVEQTSFPSGGSSLTPAHHFSSDFRFKTYAPIAFRYFRDLFGIQPDDFLMSMVNFPMRELSNPGASGSIFYLTDDDEFIVKTVLHKECEFLQKLLPGYYMNLNQNPRTLLPKFFGLFCYQCNSKNVRLVVMNNLLPSSVKMHQKYDLKGSTYKRKASKAERSKQFPTFKDLDFVEHHPDGILLEADTCSALLKTMQRDCRVLESFKIMDYSLLVGIHNLDIAAKEKVERRAKMMDSDEEDEDLEFTPGTGLSRSKSINRHKLVAHSTALESIQADSEPIDADDDVPPGGIPARNAKGERLLLFLGLIDILQSYRLNKKLEHIFKAMIHDGDTVSVHRPGFYAERFMNFMSKSVFRKIPSLDLPEVKGNHRKFRNLVSTFLALKHSPSKKRPPTKSRPSGDHTESQDTNSAGSPPLVMSPKSPPPNLDPKIPNEEEKAKKPPAVAPRMFQREKSEGESASQPPPVYPAVLSKETRPQSMNRGKVPPPVPPRTPKKTPDPPSGPPSSGHGKGVEGNSQPVNSPPVFREGRVGGVVAWNLSPRPSPHHDSSEPVSISEVYVETRQTVTRSNLSVASSSTTSGVSSGLRHPRSPQGLDRGRSTATPTWTEGTPSFTESSSSGDLDSSMRKRPSYLSL